MTYSEVLFFFFIIIFFFLVCFRKLGFEGTPQSELAGFHDLYLSSLWVVNAYVMAHKVIPSFFLSSNIFECRVGRRV